MFLLSFLCYVHQHGRHALVFWISRDLLHLSLLSAWNLSQILILRYEPYILKKKDNKVLWSKVLDEMPTMYLMLFPQAISSELSF